MVFYAAFNSISVISRRQFTLLMSVLGFASTRLGSEVSCPRTLPLRQVIEPSYFACAFPVVRPFSLLLRSMSFVKSRSHFSKSGCCGVFRNSKTHLFHEDREARDSPLHSVGARSTLRTYVSSLQVRIYNELTLSF